MWYFQLELKICMVFVFQIFEKALDEPKYSTLYAQLCHRLCQDAPNFEPQSSNISVRLHVPLSVFFASSQFLSYERVID